MSIQFSNNVRGSPHAVSLDERIYPTYKIAKLASLLSEQGFSKEALILETGIDPEALDLNTTRISRRQLIQAYRNAVRLSRDPAIGLTAGGRLGLTDYGIYGYGLVSSATLRKALEFSIKYHQLATPTVRMSLITDNPKVAIFRMEDELDIRELYQFNIEMQFALVNSLFKEMAGEKFRFSRIEATYAKPKYTNIYSIMFGCTTAFSCEYNDMVFAAEWLDLPLHRANPITSATTRELCDQILLDMHNNGGVAHAVYMTITKDLRHFCDIGSVAQALHMSTRTLSRKLSEQETTFSDILNEVRMRLAIEFLKHTAMSTEEISDRLGFSDPANFRHAFKRWTQMTTSQYR